MNPGDRMNDKNYITLILLHYVDRIYMYTQQQMFRNISKLFFSCSLWVRVSDPGPNIVSTMLLSTTNAKWH